MNYKELDVGLQFMDAAYYDKKLWFVEKRIKKLCSVAMDTGFFRAYDNVVYEDDTCRKVFIHNNKMYFISTDANVTICNLTEEIAFHERKKYQNGEMYIVKEAFIVNESIWFVPLVTTFPLVIFDMNTEVFSERNIFRCDDKIAATRYNDGSLYFSFECSKELLEYNLDEERLIEWELEIDCKIAGFDCEKQNFWFKGRQGLEIYKWSKVDGLIEKYSYNGFIDNYQDENAKVRMISNDTILILPGVSDGILCFNKEEGGLRRIQGSEKFSHVKEMKKLAFSIGNIQLENKLILFPWGQEKLISIDLETKSAEQIDIFITEEDYYYVRWQIDKGRILIEDEGVNSLKERLNWLSKFDGKIDCVKEENKIGKNIVLALLK